MNELAYLYRIQIRALKFIKRNTSIPVPEVILYRTDELLPSEIIINKREEYLIEARRKCPQPSYEYLIMSEMPGESLGGFWEDLTWEQRKVLLICVSLCFLIAYYSVGLIRRLTVYRN